MIIILVIILCVPIIECQSMCEYMKSNGTYNDIQLYRQWQWNGNTILSIDYYSIYMMYKTYPNDLIC